MLPPCVKGEPVENNILGVACNLDAWWGGRVRRDSIRNDSSDNCSICSASFSATQLESQEGKGWGAGSNSISSLALDGEAGWREQDPSWVDYVESSSSVNGKASFFELDWRGRTYAEGELADNNISYSAGTFSGEWGGQDGVGNESILYCTQPPHAEKTKLLCPHHEGACSPHPIRVGGLIYGIRWRWWIPWSSKA